MTSKDLSPSLNRTLTTRSHLLLRVRAIEGGTGSFLKESSKKAEIVTWPHSVPKNCPKTRIVMTGNRALKQKTVTKVHSDPQSCNILFDYNSTVGTS